MAEMRMHEREKQVRLDSLQVEIALSDLQDKYDLTDVEMLQALNSYQQTKLKYMLRFERHGDYDKPGGLA